MRGTGKKGYEIKIVTEGSATKLIPELAKEGTPMFNLYRKVREQNFFKGDCVAAFCKLTQIRR